MLIMRGLMDTVDVEAGPDGTSVVMQLALGRDSDVALAPHATPGASPVA
jgi:hypothetical protein